jgi:TonB family protein
MREEGARPPGQRPLWRRAGMLRLVLAGALIFPVMLHGEEARKLRSSAPPEYPELARRLNIRGTARVQATIAADGTVTAVKELGGNPVLVDALSRAVKKWRYEAADKVSIIEVKFDFMPN